MMEPVDRLEPGSLAKPNEGVMPAGTTSDLSAHGMKGAAQSHVFSHLITRRGFVTAVAGVGAATIIAGSATDLLDMRKEEVAYADEQKDPEEYASHTSNTASSTSAGSTAELGTNYDAYPIFQGTEKDEYGFTILTEAAAGCQLKEGVPYRVRGGGFTLKPSGNVAGLVARNNLLHIDKGAMLVVYGCNAQSPQGTTTSTPGMPGIALPANNSLCIVGDGDLTASGGKAGDGAPGANGTNGDSVKKSGGHYQGGTGGAGGQGGPGAGAGIGTAGSLGGAGGAEVVGPYRKHNKTETDGFNGNAGAGAQMAAEPGCLCIGGALNMLAHGGELGAGGCGGAHGNNDKSKYFWRVYNAGYGGGGGGGGGGSRGNGVGCGGTGGMGGCSGGSGGLCYRNAPFHDKAPQGEGGVGGFCGAASTRPGGGDPTRADGRGDRGRGDWTREFKNGGHSQTLSASSSPSPTPPPKAKLYAICGSSSRPWPKLKGSAWDGSELDGYFTWVDNYLGFANAPNNGAWYVKNVVCNQKGDGAQGATICTIMALTTQSDIERDLRQLVPKREGDTFLGWEFTDHDSKVKGHLLYNAENDAFDFSPLKSNLIIGSDNTEFASKWMSFYPATFRAKWKSETKTETFTVLYLPNGSTFTDATGKSVTEYKDANGQVGKTYTFWDGKTSCTVKPPAGISTDDHKLQWNKKKDGSDADIDPGAQVFLQAKAGETLTYYAVWSEDDE